MTIEKVQHLKFDTKEQVKAATISASNELVLLMDSGYAIRYDIDQQKREELFSVKTNHRDGGFDINAPSTIYTLNSIVVVVNDFKRHGFIHNRGDADIDLSTPILIPVKSIS